MESKGIRREEDVTCDPHAFNSLKNDYPEFGLKVEFYHHSQLIDEWIKESLIRLQNPVKERVVYHDSCCLARYNGTMMRLQILKDLFPA